MPLISIAHTGDDRARANVTLPGRWPFNLANGRIGVMDEALHPVNHAEAFQHYRVLLFSIAYRMTGSARDAEDLLQETYFRYHATARPAIISLNPHLPPIIT